VTKTAGVPVLNEDLRDRLAALSAVVFDFDGVFTDNTVRVDQNGVESVTCWRSDGLGLARLRDCGVKALIMSTEPNPVVALRAAKLKTECISGVPDKDVALRAWAARNDLLLTQIAYVGNDINDIPAFKSVGLAIAVADAYGEVMPYVKYKTAARGGFGAVREVCDAIVMARVGART
jgi:3-deoxy-D-manno-octulosonate 8-phosphate phosphatase (KDO 8-P phosphatase)